jgi:hypothetical protein
MTWPTPGHRVAIRPDEGGEVKLNDGQPRKVASKKTRMTDDDFRMKSGWIQVIFGIPSGYLT